MGTGRAWVAAAAAAVGLAALAVPGGASARTPPWVSPGGAAAPARYVPREILVKFKTPSAAAGKVQMADDKVLGTIPATGVVVVKLQPGETVASKLAEYRARGDVAYAEPNYVVRLDSLTPDDPLYSQQWGLANIFAPEGWAIFPGAFSSSGAAPIAIVDSGVDAAHPDLVGKVDTAHGAGCLGSGFLCSGAYSSSDDFGHGTHVAGIAAAMTDNGVGVAGVSPGSPIIPVKVCFTGVRGCPIASIASGIAWAVNAGGKVINMSLGGPYSPTICAAVSSAISHGVVVVASAGNNGVNTRVSPAGCPGAIGVAANANDTDSAGYSNWDYPDVFISAPGGNDADPSSGNAATQILSSVPFDIETHEAREYQSIEGTSMAAPFVSGLSALLVSQRPTRTPVDVRRVLAKTADKVGAGFSYCSPTSGLCTGPYYGYPYGQYPPRGQDPFHTCVHCTWHLFWGYGQIDVAAALTGAPPEVVSFSPLSGPAGTMLTINGEDLATASQVDIGSGSTSAIASITSESTIRVAVPAGATTGHVSVTTPVGPTAVSAATFKVTPSITGFSVPSARRGDPVQLDGHGFTGVTSVRFGAVAVPPADFHFVTDGEIDVDHVPPTAVTGKVTVVTPSGSGTSTSNFVVILGPTVSSFAPAAAPVGATVTVNGANLDTVTGATLNLVDVGALVHVSATQLRFVVPDGATTGRIAVTNDVGTGTSTSSFKVTPRVDSFLPTGGAAGDSVTISGKNFTGATAVRFGTVNAPITAPGDTDVTVNVPATAVSSKITVTTPAGSGTSAATFVVVLGPTISSLSPTAAPVGALVTVNGTHLDSVVSGSLPDINGDPVDIGPVTVVSPTQLRFTIPAGAVTGHLTLARPPSLSTTSTATLRVTPTVSGFTPSGAGRLASVVINGSNFMGASAVKFGSVAATTFHVDDNTHITATVPATATSGKVTVTTPAGSGTSAAVFLVELTPSISSFSPTAATIGATVTVNGVSLDTVTSGQVGSVPIGAITHVSPTQLRFLVPPDAVTAQISLQRGLEPPVLSTAQLKVLPKITSFAPTTVVRGDDVVIQGTGFDPATLPTVRFGTAAASIVNVDSTTQITATVPPTAVTGKISVTTAGGAATSTGTLTVSLAPTITSFTPTSGGPVTAVSVSGANLAAVDTVSIGGVDASSSLTHPTSGSIRFIVPSTVPPGAQHIQVQSPAGSTTSSGTFNVLFAVTDYSPTSASIPGTIITINGPNVGNASLVLFNGIPAVPTPNGPNQLTVPLPPGSTAGPIDVILLTGETARAPVPLSAFSIIGFVLERTDAPGLLFPVGGASFVVCTKTCTVVRGRPSFAVAG